MTIQRPFIGLDVSLTSTGIAVVCGGKYSVARIKTQPKDFLSIEYRARHIMLESLSFIKQLCAGMGVEVTGLRWGLEGYAMNNRYGKPYDRAETTALIVHALWNTTGKLPIKIPPQTLKKYVTGKGKAEKSVMLLSVHTKWGVDFDNDDIADAFSVAKLVEACYTDPKRLYAYEKQCVETLKKNHPYIFKNE